MLNWVWTYFTTDLIGPLKCYMRQFVSLLSYIKKKKKKKHKQFHIIKLFIPPVGIRLDNGGKKLYTFFFCLHQKFEN